MASAGDDPATLDKLGVTGSSPVPAISKGPGNTGFLFVPRSFRWGVSEAVRQTSGKHEHVHTDSRDA